MKSIKINLFYNTLLNLSTVFFPLITAPYVARVLEPNNLGLFNFSNTYAGYFALFAALGIPTYGIREISQKRDDKTGLSELVSELMTISLLTTILISGLYLISLLIINDLSDNILIFFIAGFVVYLTPFRINWFFQGIEEFKFITARSIIVKTISVICLFIFVRTKDDLVIYVIISVLSIVLNDICNCARLWSYGIRPRIKIHGVGLHVKPLFILFSASVATSIYTMLDTLMLGFLNDYSEVAYYTNAVYVIKVIIVIISSISGVAIPRISYYAKNKEYDQINILISKSFSFVSFLAIPAAIGMACISSTFVPLFYGSKFVGSIAPMMILCGLFISLGLNNLTGAQVLLSMGYDKYYLYAIVAGAISNFIFNFILIPYWGAIGASISTVIAETLILIITAYYVYKATPIKLDFGKDIFKAIFGSVAIIPLFYLSNIFFEGWSLVILFCILSCLLYLSIELLIGNSSARYFVDVFNNIKKTYITNK